MQLIEVTTAALSRKFIQVNALIHKNDTNYIRPLDKDINDVFNPSKNKAFRHGYCIRWILTDEKGALIGRIAAFVNDNYKTKGDTMKYGGCGFFDCINNQEAANMLLNAAKNWLQYNGCLGMDGPINFGERDKWWGLVVKGFQQPLYNMNYNPEYYVALFENFGFKKFFNQICFGRNLRTQLSSKFIERHKNVENEGGYAVRCIAKKELDKYAADFTTIYNKAWSGHGGMKQLHLNTVKKMFATMKPIMDERIIYFAYKNEEPIAFFVNLPDLNQYFKNFNGKLGLLQKLQLLWMAKQRNNSHMTGLVFGVIPEYQSKGVDSYIIVESSKFLHSTESPYEYLEIQWIGEFNPKMINVVHTLETEVTRVLRTYRYHFDESIPVVEHPVL
jgi:hypothetical protein